MNKEFGNEEVNAKVKELRKEGIKIYSYSRLDSFNNCQYGYHLTYNEKNKGENNIYSDLGTFIHEYLENSYRDTSVDVSDFNKKLNSAVFKAEMKELVFPNEVIEKSWMSDMGHFTKNFKRQEGDFELEKAFLLNIKDKYLMGYIDAIQEIKDEDGNVLERNVIDFKTSSMFTGNKLISAGRQLVIYKMALEQQGLKIDNVMWNMLKYVYVCKKLKNGKETKKKVNRGKIIKTMRTNFYKLMIDGGMSALQADVLLDQLEKTNDFNELPQSVKDVYWLEDCLMDYSVTPEVVKEVEDYILETVSEIENKSMEDELEWEALNVDKENFFCNTLCNHRTNCKFLKQWKKDNPFKKIGF